MKRDRSRRYGIVRVFLKLTTHIIRCAPWSFAGAQCGMASYGIILGLTTVITQRFFDAATDYSNGFGQNQVIFLLAVLVVIHIFSQILNGATYVFLEALVQRIDGRLSMEYHEKTGRIAPEKFEGTQMLDFLNKAMQGKSNSIWFVLSIFLVFTYYLPYYAVMSVYLSSARRFCHFPCCWYSCRLFSPSSCGQSCMQGWRITRLLCAEKLTIMKNASPLRNI